MEMLEQKPKVTIKSNGITRHNKDINFGDKVDSKTRYYVIQQNNILNKFHLCNNNGKHMGWFYEDELMFLT